MIGLLCNQTVSLKTDSKTLNYSVRKLKYSPILKHDKNALTAAFSLTCLEIRSRKKEAINSSTGVGDHVNNRLYTTDATRLFFRKTSLRLADNTLRPSV